MGIIQTDLDIRRPEVDCDDILFHFFTVKINRYAEFHWKILLNCIKYICNLRIISYIEAAVND